MKLSIVKISAMLAMVFFLASCEKEELESNDSESAQTSLNSEGLMEEIENEVALRTSPNYSGSTSDCPTVTHLNTPGTYPNTITLDYGPDGCIGPWGHERKGQIVIEVSDQYFTQGSIRSVTPVNFSIDDWQFEGNRVVTNLGENSDGNLHWSVEVSNAQVTDPDGAVATWEASRVRTLIAGANNETVEDDIYEITGGSSGVGRRGQAFTATITVPLVKPMNCKWIVSGVREVTAQQDGQQARSRTLDFGNGDCDDKAMLTFANGTQREITIRR